jgi:hypothetical protein
MVQVASDRPGARTRAQVSKSGGISQPISQAVFHDPSYEALRETAFHERCKIHDLIMEGIGLALRKRGYPANVRNRWELTQARQRAASRFEPQAAIGADRPPDAQAEIAYCAYTAQV